MQSIKKKGKHGVIRFGWILQIKEDFMSEILDSGARREFGTGAVRDIADGKGRCDLLPLMQVSQMIAMRLAFPRPIRYINDYVRKGITEALYEAINSFAEERGWDIYSSALEVSKQYEQGCQKYGDRNWEKGIPVHCYIDSGVRHYLKWRRGDKDEPHDRAFIWNMLGAIWTHENKPELIDLPFKETNKESITDEFRKVGLIK
jgi:hypothetical protein